MSIRGRPTPSRGVIKGTALFEDLLNLLQVSKHLLHTTAPMYDDLIRRHLHDASIQVHNGHALLHPAVRLQQPRVGVYTPLAISLATGTACIVDPSAGFARAAAGGCRPGSVSPEQPVGAGSAVRVRACQKGGAGTRPAARDALACASVRRAQRKAAPAHHAPCWARESWDPGPCPAPSATAENHLLHPTFRLRIHRYQLVHRCRRSSGPRGMVRVSLRASTRPSAARHRTSCPMH